MIHFFARFATCCIVFSMLLLHVDTRSVSAQEWVRDMFPVKDHDFGIVPRGAKAEYAFEFTNKYQEDLHVSDVRSSCGCTLPRIENADLKTYQKGAIICEFNTRSFVGGKSAVVTVVFDRPYYGEMQLTVKGNIRSDIVTEPGEIQFGEVEQGAEKTTSVQVTYAGRSQWEISDVRSANSNLGVVLGDAKKTGGGRVEYTMQVRLKDTAPAGDFSDQIVLVTNDRQFNLVTIPVRGSILPPLVLPTSVELGTTSLTKEVTGRIFVKGKVPFEITKIECEDSRFEFTPSAGSKAAHFIPLKFTPSEKEGAFRQKVTIHTTLPNDGVGSTFISGNVVAQ
ncbi:DUF1573 domain-containing protein [Aureliella helgolandensis]|uniref:DUF1573 domain-containing protein n=1 Tax=Aureliella helgolandensis TaxID=2527968 RepID=A0A518GG41_9BACT|nr:DUF1573 domain-containing protein [Aureliella helgolandensis]QDV27518.1 hypothetical protein Q31a_59070 [Aureliella helgolandensis]